MFAAERSVEGGVAMARLLTERYGDRLHGVLSCYDRIVITGTLPGICYAAGMTGFLNAKGVRIFDYARFAEPLRDRIRDRAQRVAAEHGVTIEHIAKAHVRKEAVVAEVLARRGDRPGLVHVISAMEACRSYRPWHDKAGGKTFLKPCSGKCLHYYFHFIDAVLGLCYLRVPTWCPFRLQFYLQWPRLAGPQACRRRHRLHRHRQRLRPCRRHRAGAGARRRPHPR
jgi:hypothetical protein